MNLFSFTDYRDYLHTRAKEEWGAITRLAEAAQCQRSYLSRAIKGEVLLTPDHLHGLCEYWRLTDEESEYLMLLLEKARATTPAYRARLERKLKKILRDQENLAKRLETPRITATERELYYYSAWHWAAIHMCTAAPALQTETSIVQALQVHPSLVKQTLLQLADWGLIKRSGARWVHASSNLHLPKQSPLIGQHHQQWRERAVSDSLKPEGDGLHYTQVQSMDEAAFREIKNILLGAIDRSLEISDAAISEKIVAVTIDSFAVS
ncbi:MAG: DUF4423 domain-containing protein [Bdellovibrionota bacterium]